MKNHIYDKELIISLDKKCEDITKVAIEYCKIKGFKYVDKYRRGISKVLSKNKVSSTNTNIKESNEFTEATKRKVDKNKKVYFVTYAQNNTPIDKNLLNHMELYAKEHDASIIVNAGIYLNPNSTQNKDYSTTWHKRLIPYLASNDQKLHKYLRIITDANVLPTASDPLRGFEGITGSESSIIGSPKQHMVTVPTLPGQKGKIMFTTGSITKPNYRKARVGKKAEFNHIMGFLIVEVLDKEDFVARHVSAKSDGSFIDLNYKVSNGSVTKDAKWDTIVMGDTHLGHHDSNMIDRIKGLAKIMKPKHVVFHDIFDGQSVNNHIKDDFIQQAILEKNGLNCIKTEVDFMLDWLKQWMSYKPVIVASNHDDRVDRWVKSFSSIKDIKNAFKINEYREVLLNELAPKGLINYEIDNRFGDKVVTLGLNDSFKRKSFELALHGHIGANGSRGGVNAFRKLNTKIITAHSHSPSTKDGSYVVGITCHEDHGYNKGIGSWMKSIGVINEFGKFQHLFYSDRCGFSSFI